MKPEQVCCLCPIGDWVGEAATWNAEEQSLYWCDINRFLIHRLHIPSGALQHWFFDQPVVALALSTEAGRLLVTLAEKLIWWWPSTDKRYDHGFKLEGYPYVRFNDGRPDPLGNFWVGSMRNNVGADGELGEAGGNDGVMFRISPNGEVTQWIHGLGISNTLCWSRIIELSTQRIRWPMKSGHMTTILTKAASVIADHSSVATSAAYRMVPQLTLKVICGTAVFGWLHCSCGTRWADRQSNRNASQ